MKESKTNATRKKTVTGEVSLDYLEKLLAVLYDKKVKTFKHECDKGAIIDIEFDDSAYVHPVDLMKEQARIEKEKMSDMDDKLVDSYDNDLLNSLERS